MSLDIAISEASGVPRYRQVVDRISDQIYSGRLPAKTRLPSVRALAVQLSVSVITIRRAYADLEHLGLIMRIQGQGTFVQEDVVGGAKKRARVEAETGLDDSVVRAHRLGMTPEEIVATVRQSAARLSTSQGRKRV